MTSFNPKLMRITEEEKTKIRQSFEIIEEDRFRDALNMLVDWCYKQEHFVDKNLNKNLLERFLVASKGSVEEAKRKIDHTLTVRGMTDSLVLKRSPQELIRLSRDIAFVPLPKLNPSDLTRVYICQLLTDKIDLLEILDVHRYCILLAEYRYLFDYAIGDRQVYDLKNVTLSFLGKFNLIYLKKSEVLISKCYGIKGKGIHLINAPSFVSKIVYLLKQSLSGELAKRIHVHSSYEDLYNHISKEVLPSDYGGEEQSVATLHVQWVKELSSPSMAEFCISSDRLVTDESKRTNTDERLDEEYFGIPGTFRKLNVE